MIHDCRGQQISVVVVVDGLNEFVVIVDDDDDWMATTMMISGFRVGCCASLCPGLA